MTFVCDLHCDLLSYLASDEKRNVFQDVSRCSVSQLHKGSVRLQTLAIYCETEENSSIEGLKQLKALKKLKSPFVPWQGNKMSFSNNEEICFLPAFENASSFSEENEPLDNSLARLEYFNKIAGPFLYLSLTWNTENRFGGGNATKIGLKKDGETLLEYLSGKKMAIDLSHTSDALACDIFNHIEKKGLKLPVIASHSNFRTLNNHPRNLPDEIAIEINKRKGVIGINLFRAFVGDDFENNLLKIVNHAQKLHIERSLCFGADFFCDNDFASQLKYPEPFFHNTYANASCYPKIQSLYAAHFSQESIENISHNNFLSFYETIR